MNMEMTLKEKIKKVISVIDEAQTVQKTNPVFILAEYFSQSNMGFPNVRDVFRILRENGAIKKMKSWWGFEELRENGTQVFVKTSSDEAQTDEDYQVYEIGVDKEKWASIKKLSFIKKVSPEVVLNDWVFNDDGLLYSKSSPQIKISFGKGTARYKIFNALVEANRTFVATEELRDLSDKKTNRNVQKEVGAMRQRIAKLLRVKVTDESQLIEGEEYSGYRLSIKVKKVK